uniref:Delta-like protein n=1 Tax=Timema cristinae TaxID=61476 RepID=A0A7R9H0Z3_TIMCR|nr:unnamed protein product [Timema cristinae]
MRWIPAHAGYTSVLVVLLAALQQGGCSGVFELRLKSFVNDYGKDSVGQCCSGEPPAPGSGLCSGPCRTRFRVCLKHYQAQIDTTSPCTFGDVMTPVLGENSVHLTGDSFDNLIRFTLWTHEQQTSFILNLFTSLFLAKLTGTFSLIVEALHDNNNSTGRPGETLITRLTTQRWLDVGPDWTEDEHQSAQSVMRYEYRVTCDAHYYGAGCASLCRPRDDSFGHYNCSLQGERKCLAGWQGDYCTKHATVVGKDVSVTSVSATLAVCTAPVRSRGTACVTRVGEDCSVIRTSTTAPTTSLAVTGEPASTRDRAPTPAAVPRVTQAPTVRGRWMTAPHTPALMVALARYECLFTFKMLLKSYNYCYRRLWIVLDYSRDNGNSSYRCECPKGWHGPHCETSAQTCDDQPCRNSATCLDNPVGYTCQCPPGYTGVDCEHEVDDCAPGPCRNNASCVDKVNGYKCVCLTGFSGTDCEVNVDDCHGNPCLNGGTCLDLVNRFRCQCVPGYVGDLCQGKVDYCRTKPCANGGVCTDRVNDYSCECRAGFSGKDCSVDIDECGSSPCRNGGTCVNRVNGFACRCPAGLRGSVCESTEAAAAVVEEEQGTAGNISRHVSEQEDEGGLSTEHVVVIATLSTAVPTLVLVGAIVVMCMKQRRKRERQRADDEARMQNEQNAVHSSMAKRGSVLVGAGDAHMIKNTWGKCVNNVPVGHNSPPEEGGGPGESETCYPKQTCPPLETGPVYTLQRTRSHKQLNTDRHSNRGSGLLHPHKGENLCPGVARTTTPGDKRHSVMSVDSSHCNSSDPTLLKRPHDKDSSSSLLSAGVGASSVYVIDEHFQDGLLATEV